MPQPAPEPSGRTCGPGGVRSGTARIVRNERRRPELGALHRVVRDNLRTLDEAIEDGFAAPLPVFVRDELEAFVRCGVLANGFALIRCPDCDRRIAVGSSCKGRGFCRARILRWLRRKGVIEDEEVIADRQLADEQPALSTSSAAISAARA